MCNRNLYIGTYTQTRRGPGAEGIYQLALNTGTGEMSVVSICKDCINPSFLFKKGNILYCSEEVQGNSALAAFNVVGGSLVSAGKVATEESGACHICPWPDGKHITLSNFGSATFTTFELADGIPCNVVDKISHSGCGPHPRMQLQAHVHSCTPYPDNERFLVCDLGNDTLCTYKMDCPAGKAELVQTVNLTPGDGPRHASFSPDGSHLTVITQLSNRLLTYAVTEAGLGNLISSVSTIPDDYQSTNSAADVHYSKNGKFIYASNRGHNSIVVFDVNNDARPVNPRWFSCYGEGPRHFALLDDSDLIIITNQQSGNVVSARLDSTNGDIMVKLCELSIPQAVFALID